MSEYATQTVRHWVPIVLAAATAGSVALVVIRVESAEAEWWLYALILFVGLGVASALAYRDIFLYVRDIQHELHERLARDVESLRDSRIAPSKGLVAVKRAEREQQLQFVRQLVLSQRETPRLQMSNFKVAASVFGHHRRSLASVDAPAADAIGDRFDRVVRSFEHGVITSSEAVGALVAEVEKLEAAWRGNREPDCT